VIVPNPTYDIHLIHQDDGAWFFEVRDGERVVADGGPRRTRRAALRHARRARHLAETERTYERDDR
jgi:hypothetical protein